MIAGSRRARIRCLSPHDPPVRRLRPSQRGRLAAYGRVSLGACHQHALSLRFRAPTLGWAYVSGNGYCNVPAEQTATHYAVYVSARADAQHDGSLPGASFVRFPQGATMVQVPFAATRVMPVKAGANEVFLNFQNFSGLRGYSCQASLVAFFTATKLQ